MREMMSDHRVIVASRSHSYAANRSGPRDQRGRDSGEFLEQEQGRRHLSGRGSGWRMTTRKDWRIGEQSQLGMASPASTPGSNYPRAFRGGHPRLHLRDMTALVFGEVVVVGLEFHCRPAV